MNSMFEKYFHRCPSNKFRCATGACIDSSHVCDGYKHCNVDGSDEAAEQCKNNVYVSAWYLFTKKSNNLFYSLFLIIVVPVMNFVAVQGLALAKNSFATIIDIVEWMEVMNLMKFAQSISGFILFYIT